MIRFLVLLHLLGVIVWVGGMAFMHFCLRPVAVAQLPPPQRVPLLAAVIGRFLGWVGAALLLIWGSGLVRFMQAGSSFVPPHWHAMAKVGAGMTVIFLLIVLRFYPRLKAAVAAQDWPAGGGALETIRKLVLVNLALGFITVALAVLGA
jgi:uncharacterized membrane protein